MKLNNNFNYLCALSIILLVALVGCKNAKVEESETEIVEEKTATEEIVNEPKPVIESNVDFSKTPQNWVAITTENDGILLDIKYATTDNFTKKQIYDCPACFMRPEAAAELKKIHNKLKEKYNYSLKVFDCFRPRPYQQRLWDIVPNPSYVTPPHKGSMHSRGLAVDLTIVDENGKDLNMGTAFDFFGKEAHHDFKGLEPSVQKNRDLLKSIMEAHGFESIRTEWWHYNLYAVKYPLDSWVWDCK